MEIAGIATAAAHADAAAEEVEPAAQGPQAVGVVPAGVAADRLDAGEGAGGTGGDAAAAAVDQAIAEASAAAGRRQAG
ncbi:MAG: hypothetical protein RL095_698 [Verrucomicrobiota bacterium]